MKADGRERIYSISRTPAKCERLFELMVSRGTEEGRSIADGLSNRMKCFTNATRSTGVLMFIEHLDKACE